MVTILPQATNLGVEVGRAFNQGAQKAGDISFNRSLLTKALGEAETAMNAENASPQSVLFSLLKGTAGIPGSERYIGPVYDTLMKQMALKNQGNVNPPGALNAPGEQPSGQPRRLPEPGTYGNMGNLPYEGYELPAPQQEMPLGTISPAAFGGGPIPRRYSPEEIRVEGQRLAKLGHDPKHVQDMMRRYNEDTNAEFESVSKGAITHNEIGRQNREFQDAYRKLAIERTGLAGDDLAVFMDISNKPELKNMPDSDARLRAANKEYQAYESMRNNFQKDLNRFGAVVTPSDSQWKNLRSQAREMEKYGQRDKVYQYASEAGWGPLLTESLFNPIKPSAVKSIESMKSIEPIDQVAIKYNQMHPTRRAKITEERDRSLKNLEGLLPNILGGGKFNPKNKNYIEPGNPLLRVRDEYLKKGVSWNEFRDMVNRGLESGSIVLDPSQTRYLDMLNLPPIATTGIGQMIFQHIPGYLQTKVPL